MPLHASRSLGSSARCQLFDSLSLSEQSFSQRKKRDSFCFTIIPQSLRGVKMLQRT